MCRKHSIRVPVHGFIEFNDWERDIINHPVFQRLRRIRQLAFSEHLYPGSTHTRFEHSLGVMHVATRLFDAVTKRYEAILKDRLDFEVRESNARTLVRLAALLHDIGHAPFSHTGEDLMADKSPGVPFTHEDYTAELIRNEMKDVIDDHPHNRSHHNLPAADIADFCLCRRSMGAGCLFWRSLVSGQLDADRMDYLLRDSHHCGVAYGIFDLDRIIDTVALVANESRELHSDLQIGVSEGGRHAAEGLILARYFMFQQVYFHPVRKAYDFHAARCLGSLLADKGSAEEGELPIPTTARGRKSFLRLDDWEVFRFLSKRKDCRHADAILNHRHDRVVHKTPEVAGKDEIARHQRLLEHLKEKGFDPWVGDADKEWYKVNRAEIQIAPGPQRSTEVPVGDPLSTVSNVVQKISESKQRLIFVPIKQREGAVEAVKTGRWL